MRFGAIVLVTGWIACAMSLTTEPSREGQRASLEKRAEGFTPSRQSGSLPLQVKIWESVRDQECRRCLTKCEKKGRIKNDCETACTKVWRRRIYWAQEKQLVKKDLWNRFLRHKTCIGLDEDPTLVANEGQQGQNQNSKFTSAENEDTKAQDDKQHRPWQLDIGTPGAFQNGIFRLARLRKPLVAMRLAAVP